MKPRYWFPDFRTRVVGQETGLRRSFWQTLSDISLIRIQNISVFARLDDFRLFQDFAFLLTSMSSNLSGLCASIFDTKIFNRTHCAQFETPPRLACMARLGKEREREVQLERATEDSSKTTVRRKSPPVDFSVWFRKKVLRCIARFKLAVPLEPLSFELGQAVLNTQVY